MSTQQHKTDTKTTKDAAKKPKNPVPAGLDVVQAEPLAMNADPGMLQRSLALANGNGRRGVVPRIQRAYGNQAAQRMITRAVRQRGGNGGDGGGRRISRVPKSGPAGQPGVIQRDSDDGLGGMEVGFGVESAIEGQRGSGQPLPDDTRAQMEGGIGADFGGVQVHDDAESHDLNQTLNSRAFTTGQDIFMGVDQYSPGSSSGQELIAHELTHVVQQGGTASAGPQGKMVINEPGDEYEQEADKTSKEVMSKPDDAKAAPGQMLDSDWGIQRAEEASEEEKEKAKEEAKKQGKEEAQKEAPDKSEAEEPKEMEETKGPPPRKLTGIKPPPQKPMTLPPDDALKPSITPELAMQGIQGINEDAAQQHEEARAQAVPPDWDKQVAKHEGFLALFGEEGIAKGGGEGAPAQMAGGGTQVNVSDEGYKDPQTGQWVQAPPKNIDQAAVITKPTFGEGVGNKIADGLLISPIVGNFCDAVNIGAGIFQESNLFGVIASILDLIIKILELVSGILGMISLILSIVAAVCGGIGAVLAAGIITAPSAPPFATWATTLSTWVAKLGTITFKIAILRMKLRVASMIFRLLSALHMLAEGKSANEIQAQLNRVVEHAVGLATDGLEVLVATAPISGAGGLDDAGKMFKAPAADLAADFTANIGKETAKQLGQAAAGAVAGGVAGGYADWMKGEMAKGIKSEETKYGEGKKKAKAYWKTHTQAGQAKMIDGIQRQGDEVEEIDVTLSSVPWDSRTKVEMAAGNLAQIQAEKEYIMLRLTMNEQYTQSNTAWDQSINVIDARAGEGKGALEGSQAVADQQIKAAGEFEKKGKGAEAKGNVLEKHGHGVKGAIESQKGNIEAGAKKGEEEGAGGDPATKQGGSAAGQAAQAPSAASNAAKAGAAGSALAKSSANVSKQIKGKAGKADGQLGKLQDVAQQKREENAVERADLQRERGELLARLEELNAAEAEQQGFYEEGRVEMEEWIAEDQAAIDEAGTKAMGDEGYGQFDAASEEMSSELEAQEEENAPPPEEGE